MKFSENFRFESFLVRNQSKYWALYKCQQHFPKTTHVASYLTKRIKVTQFISFLFYCRIWIIHSDSKHKAEREKSSKHVSVGTKNFSWLPLICFLYFNLFSNTPEFSIGWKCLNLSKNFLVIKSFSSCRSQLSMLSNSRNLHGNQSFWFFSRSLGSSVCQHLFSLLPYASCDVMEIMLSHFPLSNIETF